MRKIIHIDMDAFFAQVEQRDHPEYRGKPLIISGNGDPRTSRGVVSTCSYEARKYGIHSAMPTAQAYKLCPHGIFTDCNFDRIKEASLNIHRVFHRYTDIVEPLSLDEAYLDVTVNKINESSATLLANRIREEIFNETGLTSSAGVSYNKFIAKVASDFNKPNGITVVPPKRAIDFILKLPIRRFWGVGKVSEKKLKAMGINYGYDLYKFKEYELEPIFGKNAPFYYNLVRGIDNREVEISRERKSVGREKTFKEDISDRTLLMEVLEDLSQKVEKDLRKEGKKGMTVTLKVKYHDFTLNTRSITAPGYLSKSKEIMLYISSLFHRNLLGSKPVRLLGIQISNFFTDEGDKYGIKQYWLPFKPEEIAPRLEFD